MRSYLTKPEHIEAYVYLDGDAEESAVGAFGDDGYRIMRDVCIEHGTWPAAVFDAEAEIICVAPLEIAEWLVRLINEKLEIRRLL